MQSKLARWSEGLIEAGVLLTVILAPLFFNIHSDRVFEPDKLTLVRSIALVMSAAWIGRFVESAGWRDLSWLRWRSENSIWRLPFVIPVTLLVLVYLLATLFSVTPRVSWAGSYQRLQGTYTTLSYVVIFALAAATIRRREQINRLVTTVIVTSIPIALFGLLQHYQLDPLPWGGDTQRRIAGHMGNAIFIAAYLIMAWPLTAVRIVDAFTNILGDEELSYADVVRSSVYIFTLAIQSVAIYWSGSRGPWLGLGVGGFALILILLVSLRNASAEGRFRGADLGRAAAFVLGVLLAGGGIVFALVRLLASSGRLESFGGPATWLVAFAGGAAIAALAVLILMAAGRGWRWLWASWLLLTLFAGAWLALFNLAPPSGSASALPQPVLETVESWRQIPTVGRFGRLLDADTETGRVRVLIWEGVLDLLAPHDPITFPDGDEDPFNFLRPLIGYGPESMYVVYNGFYLPELATLEARNASPDRSHNETFDALVITGALGFLVWQVLYLSVFYYGFRWLGVVRSSRDRNVLIAFWVGGAIAGAALIVSALGLPYLGVAIPFGSIAGLVLYLIYYALFTRTAPEAAAGDDPFGVDRLLLLGLVAAIIAHYVEINFGIAIASTRLHFFVYVALLFLVGHLLPRLRAEEQDARAAATPAQRRRTRRPFRPQDNGWLAPLLAATFILTVIVATLGYEFMNYTRPLDLELNSLEDVPTAASMFHQAFLTHAGQNFRESPFIFLVVVMTWGLGILAFLSEMVRQGILRFDLTHHALAERRTYAGAAFTVMVLAGAGLWLAGRAAVDFASVTQRLGYGLLLIWSAVLLFAVLRLFTGHPQARTISGVVALLAILFALPVFVAGSLYGWVLLLGGILVLFLFWDSDWSDFVTPVLLLGLTSFVVGIGYAYYQAGLIRAAVFLGPDLPASATTIQRLLAATGAFAGFLTRYYLLIFGLLLLAAFALARRTTARNAPAGTTAGFIALGMALAAAFFLVNTTNLRIVQADIIYKQARPLDAQATAQRQPELWDAPIAIYEHALERAPLEDFYYLFLGRALLEKAAIVAEPAEQEQLLEEARARLLFAQEINPLNTDHTANLARLTTRWATLPLNEPAEQEALIETAIGYYQSALALSPQNSVIRNEYGNLLATLAGDCDAAIATFEESLAIDPYFDNTYLSLAGALDLCAAQADEATQAAYYRRAAGLVEEAVARGAANGGLLLTQASELYGRAGEPEAAIAALEDARTRPDLSIPLWEVDYRIAILYQMLGDLDQARTYATAALEAAPAEEQPEIETFLDGLE